MKNRLFSLERIEEFVLRLLTFISFAFAIVISVDFFKESIEIFDLNQSVLIMIGLIAFNYLLFFLKELKDHVKFFDKGSVSIVCFGISALVSVFIYTGLDFPLMETLQVVLIVYYFLTLLVSILMIKEL